MGKPRGEVYHTFKQARVRLKEGVDLPDDHLSFELEFLSILCDRAIAALEDGDFGLALETVRLQREFLDMHILSWFDRFFNLSNRILKTRFYKGVLKVTKGLFETLPEVLDDLIAVIDDNLEQ
jgi:TorA maturation chaperone TorD